MGHFGWWRPRRAPFMKNSMPSSSVNPGRPAIRGVETHQSPWGMNPGDASGALIEDEEFMGAPFPVAPPGFMPQGDWCVSTPRIAGLPGYTDDEAIEFFMNGARLGRHQPKWPMPPFHMNRTDAEAVVAYLRSLPASRR